MKGFGIMHQTRSRTRLASLVLAVIATLLAGACRSGASVDKAGGSGEPVMLRMANPYGELGEVPAVAYFVDRVKELSGGDVRIAVVNDWGDYSSDAEQQVVRDVSSGEVDLGWAGTRVFDTMGFKSFQAVTAPMLVDSYALEDAVIESGITDQMMHGLDDVGVVGLGVLADGLRKPIGVTGPILGPVDWRGITFGTLMSGGQTQAIRAFGATPAEVFGRYRDRAIANGTVQGFELNLHIYMHNPTLLHLAPYVTANVDLWPQMDVLLANPDHLAELTGEQRGWIQQAADDAANQSADLVDTDATALRSACDGGARFADAPQADLAALRDAFAPVYANLEQDSETKAFIEQIQELKRSTPAGPELAIPADCTGKAPEQPTGSTGTAPAYLNGTYRYVLTQDDADKVGDTDTGYPTVVTVTLKDGHLEGGCFGSGGGTYSVDDDRITFHSVEYGYAFTVTFSVDNQGNLNLTPVPPMDPGDAFNCFYKPWTTID
jgi:TRAP-type C4-dicarboxylate transport system substrate-binding protein